MADTGEASNQHQLHMVFFPLMADGHILPLFDIARLFASRGNVKATFITTPANAPILSHSLVSDIHLEILPFPSQEAGLPPGVENIGHATGPTALPRFLTAVRLLGLGLDPLLDRLSPKPSCLVSDGGMPWTAESAARLGIPRLVFHGNGYFAVCVMDALRRAPPPPESTKEEFEVMGLPGEVRMLRSQMWTEEVSKVVAKAAEAEGKSFGVVMNSFDELEGEYVDHYRKVMGRRAWSIGPVSLWRNIVEKTIRGEKENIDEHECLRWLDSKPTNSIIYICFGSVINICSAQLGEIAMALEALGQQFIWVIKRPLDLNPSKVEEEWLPSGFEDRNQGKGLVIKGWVPQAMILDHRATGGFVTHCGWNSTLEGISSGVPMVTWPVFAEQFMNEKLITEVLRVGVPVGTKKYWPRVVEEANVGREMIEEAIKKVMAGEEAEEMRKRAGDLKDMAWKAVEEGGSSYKGFSDLLRELRSFHARDA